MSLLRVLASSRIRVAAAAARTYSEAMQATVQEEFRVLNLVRRGAERITARRIKKAEVFRPRSDMMSPQQDWSSVWPGPRTFHPAAVPLPLRQGYNPKSAPPAKVGNTELMKIPNFLHLTPPAIKRQCQALRRFCTAWPLSLTPQRYRSHYPVEVITSDYCHSSPDIRDPLARVVTIKVHVSSLGLDAHARDKLLRLVGARYDAGSDTLTIAADRCPLRRQNYDYTKYVLTALYHESRKVEEWEEQKTLADMERYDWDAHTSRANAFRLLSWPGAVQDTTMTEDLKHYKQAVEDLFNAGEDMSTLARYKEAAARIVGLGPPPHVASSQ